MAGDIGSQPSNLFFPARSYGMNYPHSSNEAGDYLCVDLVLECFRRSINPNSSIHLYTYFGKCWTRQWRGNCQQVLDLIARYPNVKATFHGMIMM